MVLIVVKTETDTDSLKTQQVAAVILMSVDNGLSEGHIRELLCFLQSWNVPLKLY